MKTAEGVQVASAALAAVAAGASWASVVQSRKALEATVLPDLHVQALRVQTAPEHMEYVIHNAGAGIAKGVLFVFVGEDSYTQGAVGVGLMRAQSSVRIWTSQRPRTDGKILCVVACRDVRERRTAWDGRGNRKRFRNANDSALEVFERMHPRINLDGLPQRAHKVMPETAV